MKIVKIKGNVKTIGRSKFNSLTGAKLLSVSKLKDFTFPSGIPKSVLDLAIERGNVVGKAVENFSNRVVDKEYWEVYNRDRWMSWYGQFLNWVSDQGLKREDFVYAELEGSSKNDLYAQIDVVLWNKETKKYHYIELKTRSNDKNFNRDERLQIKMYDKVYKGQYSLLEVGPDSYNFHTYDMETEIRKDKELEEHFRSLFITIKHHPDYKTFGYDWKKIIYWRK